MVSKREAMIACTVTQTRNDVTGTIRKAGGASLGIGRINEAIALTNQEANAAEVAHCCNVPHSGVEYPR